MDESVQTPVKKRKSWQSGDVRITELDDHGGMIVDVVKNGEVIASRGMEVSYEALAELGHNYRHLKTVLDVGAGTQNQATIMRALGFDVTTLDPCFPADIEGDVLTANVPGQYDIIFCSHVLEHQRDIGKFLDRIISLCKPGGVLCISVPPEITPYFIACHPNQFSGGMLLYHLILAGIDCRKAKVLTYGYNVSVIVENVKNTLPIQSFAHEEAALPYFPSVFRIEGKQVFGPAKSVNWQAVTDVPAHPNAHLEPFSFTPLQAAVRYLWHYVREWPQRR